MQPDIKQNLLSTSWKGSSLYLFTNNYFFNKFITEIIWVKFISLMAMKAIRLGWQHEKL